MPKDTPEVMMQTTVYLELNKQHPPNSVKRALSGNIIVTCHLQAVIGAQCIVRPVTII